MKKIFIICITGLLVFVFTGVTFALDEEDILDKDIALRYEKRMDRLMDEDRMRPEGARTEAAQVSPTDPQSLTIDKYRSGNRYQQETPSVAAAKKDLSQRLGIEVKMIEDFRYEIASSMTTQSQTTGDLPGHLKIGLVYKGVTYIYDGDDIYNNTTGENTGNAGFTGTTMPAVYDTKGNLILNTAGQKADNKDSVNKPDQVNSGENKKEGTYTLEYSGGLSGHGYSVECEYMKKGDELWVKEGKDGEWRMVEGFKDIESYLAHVQEEARKNTLPQGMPDALHGPNIILNGEVFNPGGDGKPGKKDGREDNESAGSENSVSLPVSELDARKDVEAKMSQSSGEKYGISGKIADAPEKIKSIQNREDK